MRGAVIAEGLVETDEKRNRPNQPMLTIAKSVLQGSCGKVELPRFRGQGSRLCSGKFKDGGEVLVIGDRTEETYRRWA